MGLNIIDAVKSGKNYRRPGGAWLKDYTSITISKEDILATDWEVEEKKAEITESELNQILNEVVGLYQSGSGICTELKRRIFSK